MQYPLHMHTLPIIMEFTCHNFAYPDFFYARDRSVLISAFSTSFLHCLLIPINLHWNSHIYSCLVFQLDIVQQEYIQQEGLNQTDLVKVAFSAQGKWLATVEEREEEPDLELHLKLWFFDEETQR